MEEKFELGDYVYAEDWCYGKIVYLTDKFAELDYHTTSGFKNKTFALEDLKHAEKPKRRFNYGENSIF